mmetsp:Transcript_15239/g.21653  ORF Transcript_15239/g.21653 Transcript_15239/m.21653 type:complete len:711 (-) Transcript_15239:1449-3581(-)
MDVSEIKKVLLTLVEPNQNRVTLPSNVKGWSEQSEEPVCYWTGITCDPIDNSLTGLNLGNGFWLQTLLGVSQTGEVDSARHYQDRMLDYEDIKDQYLHKKRETIDFIDTYYKQRNLQTNKAAAGPTFPSALGKLDTLRLINLSSNQIQGPIPKSITDLPNLEIFDVTKNDIIGPFPHFQSDSLMVLDISKNRFHGSIPQYLFGHPKIGENTAPYLKSLVKFDISHNGFNYTIPLNGDSGFYDKEAQTETVLKNLQYFDLGYNLFSGTIPNNIGNFASLQGLFLENNRLVGTIPKVLYRGSGIGANPLPLVQLFLQGNMLSGTLPSGLAELPNLKELYVDGNKLTGTIPSNICNKGLNEVFINDETEHDNCDNVVCPANSVSFEGVAPCTRCEEDGSAFRKYLGQRDSQCRPKMSETEILDLFFDHMHGNEWLDETYIWEAGSPPCQRPGVGCDDSGKVTSIILPSMGLRGPLIPELGLLGELHSLDLSNNFITGFVPSEFRFVHKLIDFDIRGNEIQGVIPVLLCITDGINSNGIGPEGTNFDLLYTCDNIACARGTYSEFGRAVVPTEEDVDGTQCMPCYDDEATYFVGRDRCTDISIAGLQFRQDDIRHGVVYTIFALFTLAFIVHLAIMARRRKKYVVSGNDSSSQHQNPALPLQRQDSPLSVGVGDDEFEDYSDDDWTAADSEHGTLTKKDGEGTAVELTRLPTIT